MAHDVFISYSHLDKPVADAACATLESRGVRCWIAPRDVLPGDEYASALVGAIHSSRLLVLVFSSGANQSPQVLREVERAVSKGLPILPLRIEDVVPSPAMEYYISSRHWLDALTTPLEQHLVQLADTVSLLLARSPGAAAPAPPHQAVKPVPPPSFESPPPRDERAEPAASPRPGPGAGPASAPPPPRSTPAEPAAARPAPAPVDPHQAQRRRTAIAALVVIGALASMRGWETILIPVFGWSNDRFAALSFFRLLVLALAFVAGGIRLRRTSPRAMATIAGLLYGGGMMLLILAAVGPWVAVVSTILTAAGTGLGYITAISVLMTWFAGRRGLVAGFAALLYGLGGFGQRTVLNYFGFVSLPAAGLVALVLIVLAARALRFPGSPEVSPAPSRTLREALGTPAWRLLWVLFFLNTAVGLALAYRPPGFGMIDPGTASRMLPLVAAVGALLFAWASDRLGVRRMLLAILGLQAVLFLALAAAHADKLVLMAVLLNGGGIGLMPVLAADTFGTGDFGAVYGALLTAWCLGIQVASASLSWGSDVGRTAVASVLMLLAAFAASRLLPRPSPGA